MGAVSRALGLSKYVYNERVKGGVCVCVCVCEKEGELSQRGPSIAYNQLTLLLSFPCLLVVP
jgi:hypothetical protein